MASSNFVYKPAKGLIFSLYGVTGVVIVLSAMSLLGAVLLHLDMMAKGPLVTPIFWKMALAAAGEIAFFVFLAGFPLWMWWSYRVTANARSLDPSLKHHPWAAAVWLIVPIASLVMPYLVVRASWRASNGGQAKGSLAGLWWTMFLLSIAASRPTALGTPWYLVVLSDLIIIASGVVFIVVVRRFAAQQALAHTAAVFSEPVGVGRLERLRPA